MSASAPPPPPPDPTTTPSRTDTSTKKPTPLPWSDEETISLIESYRDKWYSLNKGHLKASQWDEVAQAVPSKTPIQCRHKIEKLRKRYRSELQKPFPYTWQFFQIMHQMEQGPLNPTPINALPRDPNTSLNYGVNVVYTNGVGSSNFKKRVVRDSEDDEDEEWSGSKTRSIKNMGGTSGNGVVRNLRNRKRKAYYNDVIVDDETSDDDDDDEDMDVTNKYSGTNKYGDDDDDEDIEVELAGEIKGFAERFLMMENGKIEMMRETERLRMEMERKKMDMIVQAQRKIVHTIGKVFASAETEE